jgi:hypothetical protein
MNYLPYNRGRKEKQMKTVRLSPTFNHKWEMGLEIKTQNSKLKNLFLRIKHKSKATKNAMEIFATLIFFLSLFVLLFL